MNAAARAANWSAHRVASRCGLAPEQTEDIRQDLIVDLIARARAFNAARGTAATFASRVTAHRAIELTRSLMRDRTRFVLQSDLDDDVADEEGPEYDELDAIDDCERAGGGDVAMEYGPLHDLARAVSCMTKEEAALFELLQRHQDVPEACRASGLSSSRFYRRLAQLKLHLRMFGLAR